MQISNFKLTDFIHDLQQLKTKDVIAEVMTSGLSDEEIITVFKEITYNDTFIFESKIKEAKTEEKAFNDLNANEVKVLKAIEEGHACSGGEFTYFEEVYPIVSKEFTKPQLKGYFSQLVQKEYIIICEELEQVNFLKKSIGIIPELEETCCIY